MIDELIDKQDGFELVRDRIALILTDESANQQILAANAAKDPALWALNIYTERSNPWEAFRDSPDRATPIVNVFFDTESVTSGNRIKRQLVDGTFNIDCYGYGISQNVDGGGHIAGDEQAALESQRAARLCRNILMAAEYTYLGFPRGGCQLVSERMPQSLNTFQPQIDAQSGVQAVATRLSLRVRYNETSPQIQGVPLDLASTEIKRASDGLILATVDIDYTEE